GAPDDNISGPGPGAAYTFVRSGAIWTQQAKLLASDGAPDDYFGFSVALSGDTALVGAPFEDGKGISSGSAYVFVRSGAVWTQHTKLLASDGGQEGDFGTSVSLSGDTALLGAPYDDANKGSAYVFVQPKPNGAACAIDGECVSGFCTEGVCCSSACGGGDPSD